MNRAQLPDEVFGIPQERKYPMPDERHTISAIKLFNHVEDEYEEQLAKAIIKNMKKYNINSSMIGDDNRLKKYLPKDMISESLTTNPISIKEKDLKDIETILKSFNNDDYNSFETKKNVYYYKIEYIDRKPIGFVMLRNFNHESADISIAVSPEYRRIGVAKKLVKDATDVAKRDKDMYVLYWVTAKENKRSQELAKECGFVFNREYEKRLEYKMEFDRDPMHENFILNKKDICINVDKFEKGDTNVLLVTGLSGSGKSTLASQLASKYKATHYELDCLTFYLGKHMSLEDAKGNEDALVDFIHKKRLDQIKPSHDKYLQLYREYIKFIISWCKKRKDTKFIIEGLQIYETYEKGDSYITSCPIVIKGTSALISSIRGAKRNVDGLKFLGEFKDLLVWALKDNKKLSQLRKDISESYLLEDTDKIKNVIFDLGNVLVSTNMEDKLALDPDIPNDKIPYIMSQWYKDEDDTVGLDEFKKIIPDRLKELSQFIPRLFEYNVQCVNDFSYTIPLINNLISNGYSVYFLSNWSKWSYELLDKHHKFDFLNKMNGGLWSWQAECLKPDEKIYKLLLDKYNLNPEECVFFDDLKENVETAKRLGIKGVVFDRLNPESMNIAAALEESFSSVKEFGATAGTVVGSNQADSVYIVNYMQNNVFSGHKEPRLGICKKGMKDLHTFGGRYNRFHYVSDLDEFKEEASDIKMYRYTGIPKNSFYEIIEDTVNDFDLYKLLTGRDLPDRSFIDYDSEFVQEECFLDTLDAIRECTEAGLLSVAENKYPVPILTETVQGRPYNYYRDLDGVFIQHEVTKIRSKSYRDKNSIPEAQVNAVKRGYLY